MKNLEHRVDRIEELKRPATDNRIYVRHAHLHLLPHTYIGEKHRVLVTGYPSESADTDCVIQEYPGPGPELKFDFDKGDGRRTLLIGLVESDGDGHTKGYWPEGIPGADVALGNRKVAPAGNGEGLQ
jgi:hypothetical protein